MNMGPYETRLTRATIDPPDGPWEIAARNGEVVTSHGGARALTFPTRDAAEDFMRTHGDPPTDYDYGDVQTSG